jgi:NADH:ubiquinone oxidoreductase subunit
MKFLSAIYLKLSYNVIGEDLFGNVYYQEIFNKKRRIVKYKHVVEATLVPPVWHAWLSYTKKEVPTFEEIKGFTWQKAYVANVLTNIRLRPPSYGAYNAWKILGD